MQGYIMQNLKKIFYDARDMEHPVPLEHSIRVLRELNETNYYYMLHRKNPIPLLDLAKEHHLQYISYEDNDGNWHILITKNQTIDLNDYLDV